ncbi:MAG TPA: caspase family protein [Allosphingosinicella sp.]|nr:caspase family protein [Allosphingosinicella sp.]
MSAVAILIANANYTQQDGLDCCLDDLRAMRALINASGRFSQVDERSDLNADQMRDAVRNALPDGAKLDEVFFYFSGHGHVSIEEEFYFCGTTFDTSQPNQTGLSESNLHDIVRAVSPSTFIKVVDACGSGTLLIKRDRLIMAPRKDGFQNLVQIASCKNDQNSFGGDPLSRFTAAFCEAALSKARGPVFYMDIINALRDEFLDDDVQTPFSVYQGTGRVMLVDDTSKLAGFRELYNQEWGGALVEESREEEASDRTSTALVEAKPLTLVEMLQAAEERMPTSELIKRQVGALFDGVTERFNAADFADLFEFKIDSHSDFVEPTARDFIIQILARQTQRSDDFVRAEIMSVIKKPSPLDRIMGNNLFSIYPEYLDQYELELNCRMERVQLTLTLVPKYKAMQQLVLVLTCAPSLEHCYVFEVVTQHARVDIDRFNHEGRELTRRWYELDWSSDMSWLIGKITDSLQAVARKYVDVMTNRLKKES